VNQKFGKYSYSKEQVPASGDFEDWIYHIKNTDTNESFDYRLNISGTTLATTGLPLGLQLTASTKGENLVRGSLEKGLEEKLQVRITTSGVELKTISKEQNWIDWKDFSSSTRLATKSDFEEYFQTYKEIFKKILKPKYGILGKAYVSKIHGSLLLFQFQPGEDSLEYYLLENAGIGSAVMNMPQKALKGNLENKRFEGLNKIIEGDKLIYIKGENTRDVWSKKVAEKEAKEEIDRIVKDSRK